MSKTTIVSLTAILLATLGASVRAGELGVQVTFSDSEIATIQAYYRDHSSPVKSGNGRGKGANKGLPPGIEKNLQRGKPLPPGIAKQVLPSGLVAQLPPPPKGYERIEVAGKILLVEIATQVIHDVLEDVILGR